MTEVLQRAAQDSQFRQELIQNPRQALSTQLGMNIPPNVQIQVLEETPTKFYLVLPPVQTPGKELSDADLAAVAGGWSESTACEFGSCNSCAGTCQINGCQ